LDGTSADPFLEPGGSRPLDSSYGDTSNIAQRIGSGRAKMVPVPVYWWRSGKNIDPKLGLVIGAVAGAGFGIFEGQWQHNVIFASGWI